MKHTGGVRIGWFHASWPFATLYGDASKLRIKVIFSEEYIFTPNQVIEIEKVGSIPFLSQGIRIKHNVSEYPENIIFYWGGINADKLITEIRQEGFRPQSSSASAPRREGIPVRWEAIVIAIVIWNVLFFIDIKRTGLKTPNVLGPYSWIAMLLVFISSTAILYSKKVQNKLLKPGRSVKEISHILYLFMLITGFMSLIVGLMLFARIFET